MDKLEFHSIFLVGECMFCDDTSKPAYVSCQVFLLSSWRREKMTTELQTTLIMLVHSHDVFT